MPNVISREEARTAGLKYYFTGEPCVHGHVELRYVSNTSCAECSRVYARRYAAANAEKHRATARAWNQKNRERHKEIKRAHYARNRERLVEEARPKNRKHYRANKPMYQASVARRRAAKAQRTPAWADLEAIKFWYECCPVGCVVDHIIPLRGRKVSGLHIAENLQWLTAEQNNRKHNKFTPGDCWL